MKDLFQKLKPIIIVIAIAFGAMIVYNVFVKDNTQSTSLLKSNGGAVQSPDKDLIPLLLKIQNVNLDEKLFLDPVFRALVDYSQPIVPESVGKSNPFAEDFGPAASSSVESLGFTDETQMTASSSAPKTSTSLPPRPIIKANVKKTK